MSAYRNMDCEVAANLCQSSALPLNPIRFSSLYHSTCWATVSNLPGDLTEQNNGFSFFSTCVSLFLLLIWHIETQSRDYDHNWRISMLQQSQWFWNGWYKSVIHYVAHILNLVSLLQVWLELSATGNIYLLVETSYKILWLT